MKMLVLSLSSCRPVLFMLQLQQLVAEAEEEGGAVAEAGAETKHTLYSSMVSPSSISILVIEAPMCYTHASDVHVFERCKGSALKLACRIAS